MRDSAGNYLDGSRTYKVTLPGPIPAKNFWSFTVYDNQTRSLLPTDQKLAGVDSTLPGVEKNADGGVTVWFGPTAPAGEEELGADHARKRLQRGFTALWPLGALV